MKVDLEFIKGISFSFILDDISIGRQIGGSKRCCRFLQYLKTTYPEPLGLSGTRTGDFVFILQQQYLLSSLFHGYIISLGGSINPRMVLWHKRPNLASFYTFLTSLFYFFFFLSFSFSLFS